MRKSLLTISLVALMCGPVTARTLSPSEALARALGNGNQAGAFRAPTRTAPVMTVGSESSPALYVFDQDKAGYLIVSADDVAAPVLGYSDSGTIDPDNLPDNLRWWLGQYKAQIEAATQGEAAAYSPVSRATREPIAPLLKTTWDQGAPYNNMCPSLNGRQTVTGCVATAMAQVMYYHKWPESFNALFNYTWTAGNANLSWSQRNQVLDWANMLPTYHNVEYTSGEGNAVATLMKACGYAVNMNYNVSSAGGSSAQSILIPRVLANLFKYDKGAYNAYRPFYSLEEWENLIYDNLKTCGPVIYSGNNNNGGHCFVCDGYSENGYFHFNWGWSGVSDGYYLLSALSPELQGIGGSTSGFNDNQEVGLGIKPANGFSSMKKIILCYGDLSADVAANGTLTLNGPFFNLSNGSISGKIGMRFVKADGSSQDVLINQSDDIQAGSGYSAFRLSTSSLPSGSWKLYPIFRYSSGETVIIPCHADQAGYLDYTKSGNTITVTVPEIGRYNITDMKMATPIYKGSKFLVTGKATWSGSNSVQKPVYGVLMSGTSASTIVGIGATMPMEFQPDGTPVEFDYVSSDWYKITEVDGRPTMEAVDPAPGDYYFAMAVEKGYYDNVYTLISTPIPVKVNPEPLQTKVTVSVLTIKDSEAVNPDEFCATAKVNCKSGYFFDNLIVAVFDPTTGTNMGQFYTNLVPIEANTSATLTAKGILSDVTPGKRYIAQIFTSDGTFLDKAVSFTVADISAIGDVISNASAHTVASPNPASDYTVVTAPAEIVRVDIASLSGSLVTAPAVIDGASARIDVSSLPAGLYIARVTTATGIETVKIIKK